MNQMYYEMKKYIYELHGLLVSKKQHDELTKNEEMIYRWCVNELVKDSRIDNINAYRRLEKINRYMKKNDEKINKILQDLGAE